MKPRLKDIVIKTGILKSASEMSKNAESIVFRFGENYVELNNSKQTRIPIDANIPEELYKNIHFELKEEYRNKVVVLKHQEYNLYILGTITDCYPDSTNPIRIEFASSSVTYLKINEPYYINKILGNKSDILN